MRIMRVQGRVLQTPVLTYRRPGRAGDVTVIGVAHLAEVAYYLRVAAVIDELERGGAAVHYELIDRPPAEDVAAATAQERAAVEAFLRDWDQSAEALAALAVTYGWVHQQEALPYPDRWRNTDMNGLELVRAIGPEAILDRARPGGTSVGQQAQGIVGSAGIVFRLIAALPVQLPGKIDQDRPVVVDRRNEIALGALPGDGPAVLIWGAEHLHGLSRGLRRAGFRRIRRSWLDVGTLPPLRRSLAAMLAGMHATYAAGRYDRGAPWPADPHGTPKAGA